MGAKKVLFLSSEDKELSLTKEEHQKVRSLFNKSKLAKLLDVAYVTYNTIEAILKKETIDDNNIEVLHFTGHSGQDGLLIDKMISITDFCKIISKYKTLKVIILNSCSSEFIGKELVETTHIQVVIETNSTIYERDSIIFSEKFYENLLDNIEISLAFKNTQNYFEKLTDIEHSALKRGNLKATGTNNPINAFPWQINKSQNYTSWSFARSLPTEKSSNKLNILHYYSKSNDNDQISAALEKLYSEFQNEIPIEVFKIEELQEQAKELDFYANFDSIVFFIDYKLIEILDEYDDDDIEFLKNNSKISFINCDSDDVQIAPFKDKLNLDSVAVFPPYSLRLLRTVETPKTILGKACKENIKYIAKKAFPIDYLFKDQFLALNFSEQIFADEEFSNINFTIIEGTNKCAHEILINKIFNQLNIDSSTPQAKFCNVIIPKATDNESNLDDQIDELWKRILAFFDNSLEDFFTNINLRNTIIIIETVEVVNGNLVEKFWEKLQKTMITNKFSYKFFIFFLNKNYDSKREWAEFSKVPNSSINNIRFKPITPLSKRVFDDWKGRWPSIIKDSPKYSTFKPESIFQNNNSSYLFDTIKKINDHFEVGKFIEEELFLTNRYKS